MIQQKEFTGRSVTKDQFDCLLKASYELEVAVSKKIQMNSDQMQIEQLIILLQRIIDNNLQKVV